ncbi:MAG: M12 family metallo-peptidase [Phycisphaerales bacterium]|nr:M12 family metallo-peptidase [Phycisphaerales bacterium]
MSVTAVVAAFALAAQADLPHHGAHQLQEALDQAREGTCQVTIDVRPGLTCTLDLETFDVIEPGARVVVEDGQGQRAADLGGLELWRGTVEGDAGSRVYMAISSYFTEGYIQCDEGMFIISTGPGGDHPLKMTDAASFTGDIMQAPACRIQTIDGQPPRPVDVSSQRGFNTDPTPCRVTRLAIDTDWELAERLYGGDADAAAAYCVTLVGAVSEIYRDEINLRFSIPFLRTWAADEDPYDPDSSTDMLNQFRDHWAAQQGGVDRTVAHMITGRTNLPYGGVAWLSVLCNTDWGYAVSGYIEGSFPYPLEDNNGGNWDLVVVAHELGHNHGTLHTHDGYSPPLDNCGNGDCAGAENGTIMSYCHTCPGGLGNVRLGFHPEVQEVMLAYMDSLEPGCDLQVEESGTAVDDLVVMLPGDLADIDVLANDRLTGCDETFNPELASWDVLSAEGGTIDLVDGTDLLRYQPASGFTGVDTFSYQLTMGASAVVTIDVVQLRLPDVVVGPAPGAPVDYYALSQLSELPDFDTLESFAGDVVTLIDFPSTGGEFITSGLSDDVGAVFTGFIDVPASGYWTLYTESDDGSKLYIGDQEVVDNDGLHGMQERSGEIGLLAGTHAIRVEFFERGGGAGLIVRWQGPGTGKQVVPDVAWSYETIACPGDANGDLVINVDDMLAIIAAWGCTDCPEDVDGSGQVDVNDILMALSAWGQSC